MPEIGKRLRLLLLFGGVVFVFILYTATRQRLPAPQEVIVNRTLHRIVVYNRVPKCGSTTIVGLFQQLRKRNSFDIISSIEYDHLRFKNQLYHQALVREVAEASAKGKLFVDGHFNYINFDQFGFPSNHVYINCLREPLDRLVTFYYYRRFGDNLNPDNVKNQIANSSVGWQSFDECVREKGRDCDPSELWIQVPFFCGYAAYCQEPGSREALATAKRRLIEDYLLVGTLEQLKEFMHMLSYLLPDFLSGLESLGPDVWHLRSTKKKDLPSAATIAFFHRDPVWQVEQEFYQFARNEFLTKYEAFGQFKQGESIWTNFVKVK